MWVCHGNSHTICDWKCFRLRVSGYPQSPVHNPNLNRLTHVHSHMLTKPCKCLHNMDRSCCSSCDLLPYLSPSPSLSRTLFRSLSAECRCNVWTTLDWRCFTLFLLLPLLLLLYLILLLSLLFTFVCWCCCCWCFAFLFYGQCFCFAWLSHKAWPGWVSDCQGGWE